MLSKSSFKTKSKYDSESSDIVFVLSYTPSNNAVLTSSRRSGNEMLIEEWNFVQENTFVLEISKGFPRAPGSVQYLKGLPDLTGLLGLHR